MRLTWIQPEDLIGHELRQATEDGRDVTDVARRWRDGGGHEAPPMAGASPRPAAPALRRLAEELMDELAGIPSPLAAGEPTELDAIISACPRWPHAPLAAPGADLAGRLLGAWQGRAAGCVLGKPVEKIPREGIREIAEATGNWPIRGWFTAVGLPGDVARRWPWNRRSAATSLAENIDGTPEDDDLNFPMLALALVERYGRSFGTEDVAQMWLDHLPAGRVFTAERVAMRNLLNGLVPPETARWRNPFREWIGAQIRADVYGWLHPGDPGRAASLAYRDAILSHTANGVYGAMFAAALTSMSLAASGIEEVVAGALRVLPVNSRMAVAVREAVDLARSEPDLGRVLDALHARHGDLHWVHSVNNAAAVTAALVHGGGDFTASITAVVTAGWDTDSDGATVGSVVGGLRGAVPAYWTDPLRDRLATSLPSFDGVSFGELAARTLALVAPPGGGS